MQVEPKYKLGDKVYFLPTPYKIIKGTITNIEATFSLNVISDTNGKSEVYRSVVLRYEIVDNLINNTMYHLHEDELFNRIFYNIEDAFRYVKPPPKKDEEDEEEEEEDDE
jgi:hypothetical protein